LKFFRLEGIRTCLENDEESFGNARESRFFICGSRELPVANTTLNNETEKKTEKILNNDGLQKPVGGSSSVFGFGFAADLQSNKA
jgi:hypothetical protein